MNTSFLKGVMTSLAMLSGVFTWSQYFELRAGSGATLVGNTFHVAAGGVFNVEIWMIADNSVLRSSAVGVSSIATALAFDRTNGSSTSAVRLDNKLNVISHTNGIEALSLNWVSNGYRAAAISTAAGSNYSFAGGAARPYVSYSWFSPPPGVFYPLLDRTMIYVGTSTVSAAALTHGEIYGDNANEAGLFLANQGGLGGPNLGGSGYVGRSPYDSRRLGSIKYAVQANPEPGTWLTLGLGIAAIAKWRKRS